MNDTSKSSQLIAHLLLKNKAIQLRPDKMFQWSSGMLSPIYCDNRILLSDHDARSSVKKAFCTMLENYQFKSVAGVATAGIAHGRWWLMLWDYRFVMFVLRQRLMECKT